MAITLAAATRERVLLFSKGTDNSPATRPWKRLFSGDSRCGLIDQSWTSFHRAPSCPADAQRGRNPNVCVNVRTLATPTRSTTTLPMPFSLSSPSFNTDFILGLTGPRPPYFSSSNSNELKNCSFTRDDHNTYIIPNDFFGKRKEFWSMNVDCSNSKSTGYSAVLNTFLANYPSFSGMIY